MAYCELGLKDLSSGVIKTYNSKAPTCDLCGNKTKLLRVVSENINEQCEELTNEYIFKCPKCKNTLKARVRLIVANEGK